MRADACPVSKLSWALTVPACPPSLDHGLGVGGPAYTRGEAWSRAGLWPFYLRTERKVSGAPNSPMRENTTNWLLTSNLSVSLNVSLPLSSLPPAGEGVSHR